KSFGTSGPLTGRSGAPRLRRRPRCRRRKHLPKSSEGLPGPTWTSRGAGAFSLSASSSTLWAVCATATEGTGASQRVTRPQYRAQRAFRLTARTDLWQIFFDAQSRGKDRARPARLWVPAAGAEAPAASGPAAEARFRRASLATLGARALPPARHPAGEAARLAAPQPPVLSHHPKGALRRARPIRHARRAVLGPAQPHPPHRRIARPARARARGPGPVDSRRQGAESPDGPQGRGPRRPLPFASAAYADGGATGARLRPRECAQAPRLAGLQAVAQLHGRVFLRGVVHRLVRAAPAAGGRATGRAGAHVAPHDRLARQGPRPAPPRRDAGHLPHGAAVARASSSRARPVCVSGAFPFAYTASARSSAWRARSRWPSPR